MYFSVSKLPCSTSSPRKVFFVIKNSFSHEARTFTLGVALMDFHFADLALSAPRPTLDHKFTFDDLQNTNMTYELL